MLRVLSPRPFPVAVAAALSVLFTTLLFGASVAAHNSLESSSPADGSVVAVAPAEIVWVFAADVPLETLTVTLIDQSMSRTELPGSTHGSSGNREVVTPLPPLSDGTVSVRWRLVSPDGHAVSGRVDFTITPPGSVAGGVEVPPTTAPPVDVEVTDRVATSSVPSAVRWALRYGAYTAIMAVVGILSMGALVWPGAMRHPGLRRVLGSSLGLTAVLAVTQLVVVAADVGGTSPWSALGSIDDAMTLDVGIALALRVALVLALLVVVFGQRIADTQLFWSAVTIPALGLLATWAFAGHAASMRWPTVGVATDVVHHAAAALWCAGLVIVAGVVIPARRPALISTVVRRFSQTAMGCVVVLVATGTVQSVRLLGNPLDALSSGHGRYLALKVGVFVAMVALAWGNRRTVAAAAGDEAGLTGDVGAIRKAVLVEFALGLVVVGLTAVLVVTPPAVSVR